MSGKVVEGTHKMDLSVELPTGMRRDMSTLKFHGWCGYLISGLPSRMSVLTQKDGCTMYRCISCLRSLNQDRRH